MEEVPQVIEELHEALNALRQYPAYTQHARSIEGHALAGEKLANRLLAARLDASLGGVGAERKHQDLKRKWRNWLVRTQTILAMPELTEPLVFP
jgi:hypothetical protein